MSELTAKQLKEILSYDPETGEFLWLMPQSNRVNRESSPGHSRPDGYRRICIDGKKQYAHRLAWLYVTGEWPQHSIDHIDGNPANNRFSNLRDIQHAGNCQNKRRGEKGSTSKYLGVAWHKGAKKWQSYITINKVRISLGLFEDEQEAGERYLTEKRKVHPYSTL